MYCCNSQISNYIQLASNINIKSKMSKRTAPYSVDEKTLEATENQDASKQLSEENGTPAPRTIVKVKKDDETPKQPEPAEIKEEPKKLLFSGLFNNNNNSAGLFNNASLFSSVSAAFNPSKIDLSSANLFTGNGIKPTLNIFKNTDTGKEGGIFGFANGSLPPVRAGEEDEDGDSAELQEKQNLSIDKSKSSGTYKYESELKNLFTGHVKKYKRNNGDLIENVEVVMEMSEKSHTVVLVVRLPATKHPIFSGILLPAHVPQLRQLNNKQENLEVVAVTVEEGKKPLKETLKLQFDDEASGKRFQEAVTTYVTENNGKAQDEGEKEVGAGKQVDNNEQK